MHEVPHPCVELDVGVLEGSVSSLSFGDPTLNLEWVTVLIREVHIWSDEEAEPWVLSKVLTELGRDVVCHTGLWLIIAWSPAELDERVVHKVRELLQIMEQNTIVMVDLAIFL